MKPEIDAEGISREAKAGLVLLVAALAGLLIANSPWQRLYFDGLQAKATIGWPPVALSKTLLHWINDGLMAIFFFVVGLEIKREALRGTLSNRRSAALPIIAAFGGMAVPALIYCAINWGDPAALRGWAIPAATDIAFAVGVLAALSRLPSSLRVFLLALAIIDDLGAILIIAIFYTHELSYTALGLAAVGLALLVALNTRRVVRIWPYLLVGLFMWVCVLESGVHATLAGVATALAVPLAGSRPLQDGPLEKLEEALSPWVAFLIVPIFAFANAGVSIDDLAQTSLASPIPLGIMLGLLVGKPLGIYGFARAAIRAGVGEMPPGASLTQLFGTAILGGIGFTMSLFIGLLAFTEQTKIAGVKFGVLLGSLLSAVAGYNVLRATMTRRKIE